MLKSWHVRLRWFRLVLNLRHAGVMHPACLPRRCGSMASIGWTGPRTHGNNCDTHSWIQNDKEWKRMQKNDEGWHRMIKAQTAACLEGAISETARQTKSSSGLRTMLFYVFTQTAAVAKTCKHFEARNDLKSSRQPLITTLPRSTGSRSLASPDRSGFVSSAGLNWNTSCKRPQSILQTLAIGVEHTALHSVSGSKMATV